MTLLSEFRYSAESDAELMAAFFTPVEGSHTNKAFQRARRPTPDSAKHRRLFVKLRNPARTGDPILLSPWTRMKFSRGGGSAGRFLVKVERERILK